MGDCEGGCGCRDGVCHPFTFSPAAIIIPPPPAITIEEVNQEQVDQADDNKDVGESIDLSHDIHGDDIDVDDDTHADTNALIPTTEL